MTCETSSDAREETREERRRRVAREWKARNRERVREYRSEYYQKNKNIERENLRRFLMRNPGKKSEYDKNYREQNAERIRKHQRSAEVRARNRARDRNRKATDPAYKVRCSLRFLLWQAVKMQTGGRKPDSISKLVGCSMEQLVAHLEAQFLPGMSWDNYRKEGWHIDHIRPCSSFDLRDIEQARACFHYTNLRPLWAIDNLRKGNRWTDLESNREFANAGA